MYNVRRITLTYTIKLTERPFYKKFTYRIKIEWPVPGWSISSQKKIDEVLMKTRIDYKSRWAGNSTWDKITSSFTIYNHMFYYFNDPKLIETFENNYVIQELCKPINQTHINVMFENIKIRIREKLFYNRFRWAIRFNWKLWGSEKETTEIVRHWLNIQGRIEREDYLISPHNSFIIYSNNKTDVAAIRLMFTEIKIIDEIKLVEELTEEEK